jgi:hypothetical protein
MKLGRVVLGVPASGLAMLSIIATQGMSNHESAASLLPKYGGLWFLLYAAAGGIPAIFDLPEKGTRYLIAAFASYGTGGALSGMLIAAMYLGHTGGGGGTVLSWFAIPCLLPWGLGTGLLKYLEARLPKE